MPGLCKVLVTSISPFLLGNRAAPHKQACARIELMIAVPSIRRLPLGAPLFGYGHAIDERGLAYANDIARRQEMMLDALVVDVGAIWRAYIFEHVIRSLPL